MTNSAILVLRSENSKLGKRVACTYAPIKQTCSKSCSLHPEKGGACYATTSYVGMVNTRLERAAGGSNAFHVARKEASLILDAVKANKHLNRNLRVHVSGDCKTSKSAQMLGKTITEWTKGGGKVWTYTHAWRTVPREAWGDSVSILASCDSLQDVKDAKDQGWVPALVVKEFPSDKAFFVGEDKFVPCPAQTREKVTCSSCGLCMNEKTLRKAGVGIAFASHGVRAKKVKLSIV